MTNLKYKVVRLRKPRKCWGCMKQHEKGQLMRNSVAVDSGEIYSSYWCRPCDEYVNKFRENFDDGVSYGEFAGEDHYQEFAKDVPTNFSI